MLKDDVFFRLKYTIGAERENTVKKVKSRALEYYEKRLFMPKESCVYNIL